MFSESFQESYNKVLRLEPRPLLREVKKVRIVKVSFNVWIGWLIKGKAGYPYLQYCVPIYDPPQEVLNHFFILKK